MEKLANIKQNVDILSAFDKAYEAIVNVAKGSIASNVVRGVVLLIMSAAYSMLRKQVVKYQIEEAKRLSEEEKQRLRAYLQEVSQQAPTQAIKELEAGF